MEKQLLLLETDENQWRMDDRTREVGRRGIARARAILRDITKGDEDRQAA